MIEKIVSNEAFAQVEQLIERLEKVSALIDEINKKLATIAQSNARQ